MNRLALGILGSGKGSNCRAILEQIRDGHLRAEARIVISDVADAGILDDCAGVWRSRMSSFRRENSERSLNPRSNNNSLGCYAKPEWSWSFSPASCGS